MPFIQFVKEMILIRLHSNGFWFEILCNYFIKQVKIIFMKFTPLEIFNVKCNHTPELLDFLKRTSPFTYRKVKKNHQMLLELILCDLDVEEHESPLIYETTDVNT